MGFVVCPTRAFALARRSFSFVVDCFSSGDVCAGAAFYSVSAFGVFNGSISLKYVQGANWLFQVLTVFVKIQSPKFKDQIARR
jgi:hypothetical protein